MSGGRGDVGGGGGGGGGGVGEVAACAEGVPAERTADPEAGGVRARGLLMTLGGGVIHRWGTLPEIGRRVLGIVDERAAAWEKTTTCWL